MFFSKIIESIGVVGTIDTIILIIVLIRAIILWASGITPVLYRLGNGLAKRKIAIFAKGDNVHSLKSLLTDSKLFKEKNILIITSKNDIGIAEVASVYLVNWFDWEDDADDILNSKPDKCAMVVYAPYNKGRLSETNMTKLDGKRHTAVTNFRGRLLNDIVTSMITTGYELK